MFKRKYDEKGRRIVKDDSAHPLRVVWGVGALILTIIPIILTVVTQLR